MKKNIIKAMAVSALLFTTNAFAVDTVFWTYGNDDSNMKGRDNAMEYPEDIFGSTRFNSNAVFVTFGGTVNLTFAPGYLNTWTAAGPSTFKEECAAGGYGCQNFFRDFATTERLSIRFGEVYKFCDSMELHYHRHGDEVNEVLVTEGFSDQTFSDFVGGGMESVRGEYIIPLPAVALFGQDYAIDIIYRGGGSDNGNFIDYIELRGDCTDIVAGN